MYSFGQTYFHYWRTLTRLLYPAYCVICRIPLVLTEVHACRSCREQIRSVPSTCCAKCATPLPPFGSARAVCNACRSKKAPCERGFSLVMYREPTNTIFHQIKYAQKPWLLRVFEAELSAFARLHAHDYDVIVPVPIDPARERERGFNQAVSIAKLLARYSKKIPIRKVLQKRKRTLPQSTLDRRQRLHNLSGAFSVRSRGHIEGRHVLLVDDIVTTGSTLRECAILLKQQGASRVDFLTIARA